MAQRGTRRKGCEVADRTIVRTGVVADDRGQRGAEQPTAPLRIGDRNYFFARVP
jgi:hypothetical protein